MKFNIIYGVKFAKRDDYLRSQALADALPGETLLWKLQMLRSASAYANSRLHAVRAQALILVRFSFLAFLVIALILVCLSLIIFSSVGMISYYLVKRKEKDFIIFFQNVRFVSSMIAVIPYFWYGSLSLSLPPCMSVRACAHVLRKRYL